MLYSISFDFIVLFLQIVICLSYFQILFISTLFFVFLITTIAFAGGRKLQAHLHVLYENNYWRELVDILQALLLQLWREQKFGIETFDAKLASKTSITPNDSRARSASSSQRPRSQSTQDQQDQQQDQDNQYQWFDSVFDDKLTDKLRGELNVRFVDEQQQQVSDRKNNSNNNNNNNVNSSMSISTTTPLLSASELSSLWKQLVLTTVAIALRCVEAQRFEDAMGFFQRSEQFAKNDDLLTSKALRRECTAHIKGMFIYSVYIILLSVCCCYRSS